MAKRSSRKGGGTTKKRPELRTGGGRQAKAERAQQRRKADERSAGAGAPVLRMRPAGVGGVLVTHLVAWAGIAALCWAAWELGRWWVVSYPDSLWLFVAIGVVAVAPAVGRVSRSIRDADAWGTEALLVPAAIFTVSAIAGPGCPSGGDCAAIGARGSLGMVWSLVVIALAAVAAWGLARWQYRAAELKRPGKGRVSYRTTIATMLAMLVFPGLLIAGGFVALDRFTRDAPELARTAMTEVERECYGLSTAPSLSVRAAPNGYNPSWTTYAVRRTNETRPGVDGKKLSIQWATYDEVHPYEATVSFSEDGQLVGVTCRKIGPGTGNAVVEDTEQESPDNNPLSPKTTGSQFLPRFFTQGVAGPTEEAKKKAAAEAKAKKAKAATAKNADSDAPEQADDAEG